MIISHKLKVIYIKLAKVAGTSFEVALSKYCGPDDILTPIKENGQEYRESLGFFKEQNYTKTKNVPNWQKSMNSSKNTGLCINPIWRRLCKTMPETLCHNYTIRHTTLILGNYIHKSTRFS